MAPPRLRFFTGFIASDLMQAQNLDFSDPAISQLYRQADTDYTAAQKALLGEQGFAQLQDYNRTLPVRELTANLAGMFAVTGDPLTPEQSERLVQALANGSAGYLKGQQALQGGLDLDWAEVDRLAAAVLAPAQLEIFQTTELPIGGEGRFWVQVNKTINEARNAEKQAHKLSGG